MQDAASSSVNWIPRGILARGLAKLAAGLVVALLSACSMQPHDVPELSDAVLCDIVSHRDTSRRVRAAAREELELRDAQCDRLTAVIRRQRMDGLRDQLAPDDPEAQAPNYTDCVLNPICKETQ